MSSTTSATLAAGIFAHESGQRLLQILLSLAERGFRGLYDKCSRDLTSAYYQQGLNRVNAWSDGVIREDLDFVKRACPDLDETYEACFVQYVTDRYRRGGRATAKPPSVLEFARRFLESLGQHETLSTGDYFAKRDTLLKRIACMDACRQTLYALVTAENVRIELLSEVSAVRPLAHATPADLDREVTPDDSVSVVREEERRPPPSMVRAPPEVERAVERAASAVGSRAPSVVRAPSVIEPRAPTVVMQQEEDHRSVVSRHDFVAVEPEDAEEEEHGRRSVGVGVDLSSARSNVSVGVKRIASPK